MSGSLIQYRRVSQPLYDCILKRDLENCAGNRVTLFNHVIGVDNRDESHTNMYMPCVLPYPQFFDLNGVEVGGDFKYLKHSSISVMVSCWRAFQYAPLEKMQTCVDIKTPVVIERQQSFVVEIVFDKSKVKRLPEQFRLYVYLCGNLYVPEC